jgi:4-amino-4-deoxy-L-arabinose transferase-like glycosyltransferase
MLVLGLACSLYLGDSVRYYDEHDYLNLAKRLVTEGEFGSPGAQAYRPPFYPWLLSLLYAAGSPLWLARFLNFVLLAGSMLFLFRICTKIAGPIAGLLAVLGVYAYPVLIYTAGTFYPQTLAGFLLLCTADALAADRFDLRRATQAGVAYGILILAVPAFTLMLVVPLAYLLIRHRRAVVIPLTLMTALATLPAFAWSARNHARLGEWAFVSTNSGTNLLLGNSPNTTADAGTNVDLSEYRPPPGASEVQVSNYYKEEALAWIRSNPRAALRLYLAKFAHYFAVSDQLATKSEGRGLRWLLMALSYWPLLAIAALRLSLIRIQPLRAYEAWLLAFYVLNGVSSAIFFTRIRFRTPVDLFLIAFVAIAVARFASYKRPLRETLAAS